MPVAARLSRKEARHGNVAATGPSCGLAGRDARPRHAGRTVIKEGKQRQDSIEQYTSAGRQDLADKEAAELAVIQSYLPKPLTEEELTALIDATIAEVGATSPREMGKVISAIMATHKGRVDGKALSAAVKARLTA